MHSYTHTTAPTQFVEANNIRFAYRRFGKKQGLRLVLNPHILGNMDSWDPAVTDGLAQHREVILFDNAGIASSTGHVPTTFAEMASNAGSLMLSVSLRSTSSDFPSVPWSPKTLRCSAPTWFGN